MKVEVALLVSALLLLAAIWRSVKDTPQMPMLERSWFHLSITWPVIVKAALGSFIFAASVDEGANYALVTYGPAAVVSMAMLAKRLRLDARLFAPGVALVGILLLSLPFVWFGGAGITGFLPLLMALPLALRGLSSVPLASWFSHARLSILLLAVALTLTALVERPNVIGLCRLDKCSVFGEVLTSPITNNGNFVGVAVAILLPWAILGLRWFPWLLVSVAAMILVEASGSRSAATAVWCVIALTLVVGRRWVSRAWIGWVALFGAVSASVFTAVGSFSPDFATWRGSLWTRAQELFWESPLIGSGPSFWVKQPQGNGFTANYSPHNIWLEMAVAGGLVALATAAYVATSLLRGVHRQERYVFVLAFMALIVLGTLEAPVQVGRIGLAPFAHLLPLMIAASIATGTRTPLLHSPHQEIPGRGSLALH